MKPLSLFILLFGLVHFSSAQQHVLGSLRNKLNSATKQDTSRVLALLAMADYYGFVQADSSLFYATEAAELADKLNYTLGKKQSYRSKFFAFNCAGNFPMAMEQALKYEKASEQAKQIGGHYFVGFLYLEMGDYPAAIAKLRQTIDEPEQTGIPMSNFFAYSQMAIVYDSLNRLDSALWYAQQGYDLGANSTDFRKFYSLAIGALGTIHVALHHYKLAEDLFRYGIQQSGQFNNIYFQARNYYYLASLFDQENLRDSAVYYAGIALQLCVAHNFAEFTLDASRLLTKIYDSEKNTDSTLKYLRIVLAAKDSVFSQSKVQQFRQFAFDEVQRQQQISVENERHKNSVRLNTLILILGVFLLIAFMLYRNTRQKQKANLLLQQEKQKVESALSNLKAAQAQLIQSEKMASLGELTAGIAHEIQNPLNFVNNFSEVNKELLSELKAEIDNGHLEEVKALATDVEENEAKINYHGKRADGIVKSMLQHSRTSSGKKEPTNINALCDEYLRLSYHGLRAKDKSFNATIQTDFDANVGKINIVPQDIGRVLLNLFNNAFYAVHEKMKKLGNGYEPVVTVSTKKLNGKVEIKVADNGTGIPQNIIDKIFQPFFTTKPTGQGTGLGLSLSYDIVKAHGGELNVESKEGEGTSFRVVLKC